VALIKDTSIRISIVTMAAVMVWMMGASYKVFGYMSQVEANTELTATLPKYITKTEALELLIASNASAIHDVSISLRVGRLDRDISERKKERRELQRALRSDPDNELVQDQIASLQEEIEYFQDLRECVIDPDKEICQ
jgi:hypothetical protein